MPYLDKDGLPPQLAEKYEFAVGYAGGNPHTGLTVTMRQKATGKEVHFFLAGEDKSLERFKRLYSHCYSLTDELLDDQWFREQLSPAERKAKQKAEKEAKRALAQAEAEKQIPE